MLSPTLLRGAFEDWILLRAALAAGKGFYLPRISVERFTRRAGRASNLSMANSREVDTSLPTLVMLLRSTLRHLEESEGIRPNDPAYMELKNSILRSIAELEIERFGDAHAA